MSDDHQQFYLEYRQLSERSTQIQRFLEQTTESIGELQSTIEALESLAQVKKGTRIFAPIANGIFVDATLNDPSTLRMNVGGKVVVAKSTEEAKRLLERQQHDLRAMRDRAGKDHEETLVQMRQIEAAIEGD